MKWKKTENRNYATDAKSARKQGMIAHVPRRTWESGRLSIEQAWLPDCDEWRYWLCYRDERGTRHSQGQYGSLKTAKRGAERLAAMLRENEAAHCARSWPVEARP